MELNVYQDKSLFQYHCGILLIEIILDIESSGGAIIVSICLLEGDGL